MRLQLHDYILLLIILFPIPENERKYARGLFLPVWVNGKPIEYRYRRAFPGKISNPFRISSRFVPLVITAFWRRTGERQLRVGEPSDPSRETLRFILHPIALHEGGILSIPSTKISGNDHSRRPTASGRSNPSRTCGREYRPPERG